MLANKTSLALLLLILAGTMVSVPALAGTLYSNGPVNGYVDAFTICSGLSVSDSFTLTSTSTITGIDFGAWAVPDGAYISVNWSIGTIPFSGTQTTATTTNVYDFSNTKGFLIYTESFSTGSLTLGPGTYYLTLQNGFTEQGPDASWDLNNGPSVAYDSYLGNLNGYKEPGTNSESFDIYGTSSSPVVPEPSSLLLMGSGLVTFAGMMRRKLKALNADLLIWGSGIRIANTAEEGIFMGSRLVRFTFLFLALSCIPAWADSIASYSVSPTTATVTTPSSGNNGIVTEELTSFSTVQDTIQGNSRTSGNLSAAISSGNGSIVANFAGMSGYAGESLPTGYSSAYTYEYASMGIEFYNTGDQTTSFPITETLSLPGATASGFSNGNWSGGAYANSDLYLDIMPGVPGQPGFGSDPIQVAMQCTKTPGGEGCFSIIYTPTGDISVYNQGSTITATEDVLIGPGDSLYLGLGAELNGQAYTDFYDGPVVPEPSTVSLLGLGIFALAVVARKRLTPMAPPCQ
jgi:hypothetical protein